MDPIEIDKFVTHLIKKDAILKSLITSLPRIELKEEKNHFDRLVKIIISQQLSTKAANTIHGRLLRLSNKKNQIDFIYNVDFDKLRSIGISNQKSTFIKGLAELLINDPTFFKRLDKLNDEEAINELTLIKGIGKWTAEIFLMFSLNRLDVLPSGDVGILNAVKKYYKLETKPTTQELSNISNEWRPFRTIACWYLWQGLDNLVDID